MKRRLVVVLTLDDGVLAPGCTQGNELATLADVVEEIDRHVGASHDALGGGRVHLRLAYGSDAAWTADHLAKRRAPERRRRILIQKLRGNRA